MLSRLVTAMTALLLGLACAGSPGEVDGTDPGAPVANERAPGDDRGLLERLLPGGGPEYREVTVPEGTLLRVGLASRLSSERSQVEDDVRGVLREPVSIDGREVLPEGATLEGTVLQAERSGRVKGLAQLAFRFHRIEAGGESHRIETTRVAYQAEPTKKEDATKIGIGAGAGAVAGAIAGGGRGAAIGSGIGAAAGTGVVLTTRGDEVVLAPGTVVVTRLTSPITVRVKLD